MRTIEFEARRRVIEIPGFPCSRGMAHLAFLAITAFVLVILLMAAVAGERRILECRRQMALLALHLGVARSERKARLVVVEGNVLPFTLVMATLAFLAKLSLMFVVLLVASDTELFELHLAVQRPLFGQMAGVALRIAMFALQRVLGLLIVIEGAGLPVLGGMAGGAFLPIAPLVPFLLIVFPMASHTLRLDLQPGVGTTDAALVATLALGILVLVAQWELGVVVIETGVFPAPLVVTTLALLAEIASMTFLLIVFLMAGDAFGRQFLRLVEQALFRQVAGIALGLAMLALQGVMGIPVMIEIDFLPATVVVAGFALGAVTALVSLFLIDLLVAAVTGLRRLLVSLVGMAFLALDVRVLAADQ